MACTTLSPEINGTERSTGGKSLPEFYSEQKAAAAELRLGAGCGGASEFLGRCPVPRSDASVGAAKLPEGQLPAPSILLVLAQPGAATLAVL